MDKNLPAVQETWVRSLGQEDPLEKGSTTHSSILAWRIPWMEETGRLKSMGSQRVRHDWVTSAHRLSRTQSNYVQHSNKKGKMNSNLKKKNNLWLNILESWRRAGTSGKIWGFALIFFSTKQIISIRADIKMKYVCVCVFWYVCVLPRF